MSISPARSLKRHSDYLIETILHQVKLLTDLEEKEITATQILPSKNSFVLKKKGPQSFTTRSAEGIKVHVSTKR